MQYQIYQRKYATVFSKMHSLSEYIIANYVNNERLIKHISENVLVFIFGRAVTSFRSITNLLDIFNIHDAHSIYRILLEAVVNYQYLFSHEEMINAYKSYSVCKNYDKYQEILDKTKFFTELPIELQFIFSKNDIIDGKISAQIMKRKKKEIEVHSNKWYEISFDEKIQELGIDDLAISSKWNSASDSIHSGWTSLLYILDDESIDLVIKDIAASSSECIVSLIKYYNKHLPVNMATEDIKLVNLKFDIVGELLVIDPQFPN
ncbi:MAG: hypothetical protein HQ528_10700 [Candidatus Marinimicrobia bacterium]|nr:hypothetical protein [Candidatus Neomarinimicrobiota bacterium]